MAPLHVHVAPRCTSWNILALAGLRSKSRLGMKRHQHLMEIAQAAARPSMLKELSRRQPPPPEGVVAIFL